MSAGFRPSSAQYCSRIAVLCASSSPSLKVCQMSAWRATSSQRLLLAAPTDQDWNLPRRWRIEDRESALDSLERVRESVQARSHGAELVAIFEVFTLLESGADAEYQPAVADVIDGARHIREEIRIAITVAGDQRADLDARGRLRPRAKHRPALEVFSLALLAKWEEMIPVEEDVDTEVLRLGCRATYRRVVAILRTDLQPDAYTSIAFNSHVGQFKQRRQYRRNCKTYLANLR